MTAIALEAGKSASFVLNTVDAFANPKTDYTDSDRISVQVTGADYFASVNISNSLQVSNYSVSSNGGSYLATVVGQTSGVYTITPFIGSSAVANSVTLTVSPTSISPARCSVVSAAPASTVAGASVAVTVIIKDQYGNVRTSGGDRSAIRAVTVGSNAPVPSVVDVGSGLYEIRFTPTIVTDSLSLTIYVDDFDIASTLWTTVVVPGALAPSSSVLSGAGLTSGVAGHVLSALLVTKDAYGNLLTTGGATVVASLTGPSPATTIQFLNVTDLANGQYTISYTVWFSGSYSLSVLVAGEKVFSSSSVSIFPDVTAPEATLVTGVTSTVLTAGASGKANLTITARDKWLNAIGHGGENFAISLVGTSPNNLGVEAETELKDLLTGDYNVQFWADMAGNYSFVISFNSTAVASVDGLPEYVTVVPGPVSPFRTKAVGSGLTNVVAGIPTSFMVVSADAQENNVTVGGQQFSISATGSNLEIGLTDDIVGTVTDNGDGTYTASYLASWAGDYQVRVRLGGNYIQGSPFALTVASASCPEQAPFRCPSPDNQCVSSYKDCSNLGDLFCADDATPFRCTVNGSPSCVEDLSMCDCPTGMIKCSSDRKCVADVSFCSSNMTSECSAEYPVLCPDNRCRASIADCPSTPVCPPGRVLCADLTCVEHNSSCSAIPQCPPTKPLRCDDQSCAVSIADCPTRLSCGAGMVMCPDQSCKSSALECIEPARCYAPTPVLCPDQSCRASQDDCPRAVTCGPNMVLCSDYSCQSSLALCNSSAAFVCPPGSFRCPGGECRPNFFACPTTVTCPSGMVRCSDGSCKDSQATCMLEDPCPVNTTRCQDGSCASSLDICPSRPSCPPSAPTLCPDGTCVFSVAQCKAVIDCPARAPYLCASGECRISKSECPSDVVCAADRPVRCPDGSCRVNKLQCPDVSLYVCSNSTVRCPDGSCMPSKSLCGTLQSCAPGYIRCWDGSCRANRKSCPGQTEGQVCPGNHPVQCADRSCRARAADCPTQRICPPWEPIRCEDSSCQGSVDLCPQPSYCTPGTILCPDGTCAVSTCGTPVTCAAAAPYKCFDGTCRAVPDDCPAQPQCPTATPFLCPDGTCEKQRVFCRTLESCPQDTPVRCPNNLCYNTSEACTPIDNCPPGLIKCSSGMCARSTQLCPQPACPLHLPYQCADGFCVANATLCFLSNGCPPETPDKCWDGSCKATTATCKPEQPCANAGWVRCPDGSCSSNQSACYTAAGCPVNMPIRCMDGSCQVNGSVCPIATCPVAAPIKCADGSCVSSIVACPATVNFGNECTGSAKVPCADGRCVYSSDQCIPLLPCPAGQVRCDNGFCRPILDFCPAAATCPSTRPFRCVDGSCAVNTSLCRTPYDTTGCPPAAPYRCSDSGMCVTSADSCKQASDYIKGCSSEQFKCSNGACVSSAALCPASTGCPALLPVRCGDGSCASSSDTCSAVTSCPAERPVRCADGACADLLDNCNATNGCPITTPVRCGDGTCKKFAVGTDSNSCSPFVQCPAVKPFPCADGSCVGDASLCQALPPCPDNYPHRCQDRSCAKSAAKCSNITCPITSPVLCDNGLCVAEAIECQSLVCAPPLGSRCSDGTCRASPLHCAGLESQVSQVTTSRRLLSTEDAERNGCPVDYPVRCWEGSCVTSVAACPLLPACTNFRYPKRCPDGSCVGASTVCATVSNCTAGLHRCEDGLCRSVCTPYNGCPLTAPFHCPDTSCRADLDECIAASACANPSQIRCANGLCVNEMTACPAAVRTANPGVFQYSVSTWAQTTIELAYHKTDPVAQLTFPSGSIISSEVNQPVAVQISPVADSYLRSARNLVDESRRTAYNGQQNLTFFETVVGPAFRCELPGDVPDRFSFSALYQSTVDMPPGLNMSDLCLGVLNETSMTWECMDRDFNLTSNLMLWEMTHCSVHALIVSPRPYIFDPEAAACDFICQNKLWLMIGAGGFLLVLLISAYVVFRIYRYRKKYKATKAQMVAMQGEIDDLKDQPATGMVGETLGDRQAGIVYTVNPLSPENVMHPSIMALQEDKLKTQLGDVARANQSLHQQLAHVQHQNNSLMAEVDMLRQQLIRAQQSHDLHDMPIQLAPNAGARREFLPQPSRGRHRSDGKTDIEMSNKGI
eukprot:GILK01001568.1.p1 GENE.GILK01001568.1~~GILK01001568.1.p1  ORF type:complete len:2272 (-),score=262.19 GILK01001568.1:150-6527(-)